MTERVLRLVASRRGRSDDVAEVTPIRAYSNGSDSAALSSDAGWSELTRELDRSRRFGNSFALLRLPRVLADGNGGIDLGQALPRRLRSVDCVWAHRRQLFVLLPEADRDATRALVTRLRREVPELISADVRLAAFPEDGLTGGALLELLERPAAHDAPALDVALQHRLTSA
jgi:hypothetical protein